MKLKTDDGYGLITLERLPDGRNRVVQIKKNFLDKFAGLFETDENDGKSSYDIEMINSELDDVYSFAVSFLSDVLKEENHKIEILTNEELDKKFT